MNAWNMPSWFQDHMQEASPAFFHAASEQKYSRDSAEKFGKFVK
jgi:hypothetical protein